VNNQFPEVIKVRQVNHPDAYILDREPAGIDPVTHMGDGRQCALEPG